MKFIFDVSKCDKIFDYLLQWKQIKLSNGHVMPPPEELKRRAYCKYHNSLRQTVPLPSAWVFAERYLSGARQRPPLPSAR
jgi:hypothetical protein